MDEPLAFLEDLNQVFETLFRDVGRCREELQSDYQSQYRRRLLVREFCTFVEVIAYHYKRLSLYITDHMVPSIKRADHIAKKDEALAPYLESFSPSELMVIEERSPVLDENGKVTTSRMFPRTLPNLRFAIATYLKAIKTGVQIDFSGKGWSAMRETVDLRNRLTHPKRSQDLTISEDDIARLIIANDWLLETRVKTMTAANAVLQQTAILTNGPE